MLFYFICCVFFFFARDWRTFRFVHVYTDPPLCFPFPQLFSNLSALSATLLVVMVDSLWRVCTKPFSPLRPWHAPRHGVSVRCSEGCRAPTQPFSDAVTKKQTKRNTKNKKEKDRRRSEIAESGLSPVSFTPHICCDCYRFKSKQKINFFLNLFFIFVFIFKLYFINVNTIVFCSLLSLSFPFCASRNKRKKFTAVAICIFLCYFLSLSSLIPHSWPLSLTLFLSVLPHPSFFLFFFLFSSPLSSVLFFSFLLYKFTFFFLAVE